MTASVAKTSRTQALGLTYYEKVVALWSSCSDRAIRGKRVRGTSGHNSSAAIGCAGGVSCSNRSASAKMLRHAAAVGNFSAQWKSAVGALVSSQAIGVGAVRSYSSDANKTVSNV